MSAEEVADFYNNLQEQCVEERSNSRILYLRGFNNWIKSMLIQDAVSQVSLQEFPCVLDLCCGKGGDMLKWQKAEVDEVVFADVASKSIEQCKMRYIEGRKRWDERRKYNNPGRSKPSAHIPFGASFVVIDATTETLAEKLPRKMLFDITSCQFALHYAFRSEKHLRKMLYNISSNLKSGGIFIGTMTDAERIVRFLRKTTNGIYKNNVCTIEYVDKPANVDWSEFVPPLFGAKIIFSLDTQVNCPEYLAYFPVLIEIAKEFKLELVSSKNFPEAIEHYNKADARALMGRMKALEEYPIDEERFQNYKENLAGKDNFKEEYAHAESKRHEGSKTDRRNMIMGTMSKSEWEAINMYTTFMFKKL